MATKVDIQTYNCGCRVISSIIKEGPRQGQLHQEEQPCPEHQEQYMQAMIYFKQQQEAKK